MSTHSDLTGLELHDSYHFVQETDPGAVGANLNWLKISTGIAKRRNAANTAWITISPATTVPLTTKGDLLGYNSAPARIPIGIDGQALVADSTNPLGLKWGTPAGTSVPDWVTNHPDTPPVSPSAFDDEFTNSATLPGGGSAIWTALNGSNTTLSIVSNGLSMILTPSLSQVSGIQQNVPATGAWTAICKLSISGTVATNILMGMFLSNGTKLMTWSMLQTPQFGYQTWNTSSSINSTVFNGANTFAPTQTLYFKIKNDLTNYHFYYSVDGVNYTQMTTAGVTSFLTATKMGLHMYCSNGNTMTTIFKFFRVTQP